MNRFAQKRTNHCRGKFCEVCQGSAFAKMTMFREIAASGSFLGHQSELNNPDILLSLYYS